MRRFVKFALLLALLGVASMVVVRPVEAKTVWLPSYAFGVDLSKLLSSSTREEEVIQVTASLASSECREDGHIVVIEGRRVPQYHSCNVPFTRYLRVKVHAMSEDAIIQSDEMRYLVRANDIDLPSSAVSWDRIHQEVVVDTEGLAQGARLAVYFWAVRKIRGRDRILFFSWTRESERSRVNYLDIQLVNVANELDRRALVKVDQRCEEQHPFRLRAYLWADPELQRQIWPTVLSEQGIAVRYPAEATTPMWVSWYDDFCKEERRKGLATAIALSNQREIAAMKEVLAQHGIQLGDLQSRVEGAEKSVDALVAETNPEANSLTGAVAQVKKTGQQGSGAPEPRSGAVMVSVKFEVTGGDSDSYITIFNSDDKTFGPYRWNEVPVLNWHPDPVDTGFLASRARKCG